MLRKLAWGLMTLLAIGVSAYAIGIVISPSLRTGFVEGIYAARPLAGPGHFGAGGIALLLGAFQFSHWLRANKINIHRWTGRIYVVAVWTSGICALVLSIHSYGGLVTHFGFGLMAVLWLVSTTMAYLAIRNGNVEQHQAWMMRSYALTLAAVTLRILLPASQVYGIPFDQAYPVIAWLSWVPNLILAEWLVIPLLLGRSMPRKPAPR